MMPDNDRPSWHDLRQTNEEIVTEAIEGLRSDLAQPMDRDIEMRARAEVTQADREAAAGLFGGTDWSRAQFLSGKRDDTDKVKAFARHRLAGLSAPPLPGREEIARECICPKCGLRHGGHMASDPEF